MEAFGSHTQSMLKWVEKQKWSLIKGQLMCASGKAAKKGVQGYASRKVECGSESDRIWLGAFIVVDDNGFFYLAQKEKFVKCSKTMYTVTLSGVSDGCLTDGFAEWGPGEETTKSQYLSELGKLKYKKLEILFSELKFFGDGKKDDPIEGMTLRKLLKIISNAEIDETRRREALVEALGKHFMRTLHWLDLERWSVVKG
uniref:Uncharacterized protein n=1 Tax=Romanomermis culicivorax TaxID=13658 RepID=A0A915IWW6_ROMCU